MQAARAEMALRAFYPRRTTPATVKTAFRRTRVSRGITAPMLRELSVQNMALIEDLRVELERGFCAWTGETGAGKTLLLTALGLLLGDRGSSELIRTGAEELRIVGTFELTRPELRQEVETRLNMPLEDDVLIVLRRLNQAGRSF